MREDGASPLPPPDELGYQQARDLGWALADSGDTAAAIPYYRRAVSLRRDPGDLVRLGGLLREHGLLDEGLDRFQDAIALEPPGGCDAAARIGAAAVLKDKGEPADLTAALDLVGSVLEREPKNAYAHWTAYSICKTLSRKQGYEGRGPPSKLA